MVFSLLMFIDYHKKNSTQQKGVVADFFYLERRKNFYNCETVKSFLLRLNETLERVSASLARKFIVMLNNFLVSSGALKHGEYIINIKEALEMGIPERVKRMREEIATEAATKATAEATAEATATTALKKRQGICKYTEV